MEKGLQVNYHRYQRYFVDIGRLYKVKKIRVYTEIILSLAAVSFFLAFAIKPTLITITELVKTIQDQKIVAVQLQDKINALGLAQSEYNLVSDDLYLVDGALPKNSQVSTLVKQIEALALQSGVTLVSINFDSVALKELGAGPKEISKIATQPAKEIGLNLAVSGDYQNLKSFLQLLNSLRRVIAVETFSFKIKGTENQVLTLSVSGKAYYLSANEK